MRGLCDQILFVISLLLLSWLGMQAMHELGHIAAAYATGGNVVRVVLHPTAISRTDVSPNPAPLIVAWAGPILGCLFPALITKIARLLITATLGSSAAASKRSSDLPPAGPTNQLRPISPQYQKIGAARLSTIDSLLQFFTGFCGIANGAYLGIGGLDRIGDAGVIMKAGSPPWTLVVFGLVASFSGIFIWHRLGSPLAMLHHRPAIDPWILWGLTATLLLVVVVECLWAAM